MSPTMIDEHALPEFRATRLAPDHVLHVLPDRESVLLFQEPPGIGKSTLARKLIPVALDQSHDFVILVVPTRALIAELPPPEELGLAPDTVVILERRPRARCGPLDAEWTSLEKSGCAALAKDRLCGPCVHHATCGWPDQIERILPGTRLIIFTEQYLCLNPTMIPSLITRTKAAHPLVILDEALFLTTSMTRRITRPDLERFQAALGAAQVDHGLGQAAVTSWLQDIGFLLDDDVDVDDLPRFWPTGLEHAVLAVQEAGQSLFGSDYHHLSHDLSLLNSRITTGQWRRDGVFEIAVRVDLGTAQAIILGPYLEAELVEERLQRSVVVANPGHAFRHSGTRVVNIRDSVGSAKSLGHTPHRNRVVDVFTALTMRNALMGKRTVLVARKRHLPAIRARVEELVAATGFPMVLVAAEDFMGANQCGPWEVPLINFGIVGVNSLKDFDAIYCIGAYNINAGHLNAVYQRDLPPDRRHALRLRSVDRRRQVESADGSFTSRFHARRARALHRVLERRVVLQAVGRARPFTSPTEVILFQQDDFHDVFGEVEVFDALAAFRSAWHVPTAAQIARAALGDRMRDIRREGTSYRGIAGQFEVSTATVHKALHMPPLETLLGRIAA